MQLLADRQCHNIGKPGPSFWKHVGNSHVLHMILCVVRKLLGLTHLSSECWTLEANKGKLPANNHQKENVETKIIVLQVIATTATRKDI